MSLLFRHASPVGQPASTWPTTAGSPTVTPLARTLLLWLTLGAVGIALFPIIYTIEGAARPGYDAWRQTISSLSLGSGGWIQQLNFALCGVSVLWSAYVWRKILAGGVCATWYPILRGIEGAALVAIAFFIYDPLHTVCLVVIVDAMTVSLFMIARRFWRNSNFRGWALFAVACGLWPMLLMPLFGMALNTHSTLAAYAGFFERLATNADTIWSLVLVAYLWLRRPGAI